MDNATIFLLIFGLSSKLPVADMLMVFGARFLIYLTFILMFILIFKGAVREKKALILAILAIPIVILLIKGIHLFIFEPRPFVNYHFSPLLNTEADASFPSRHASIMSAIAFSYTYFKSKWAPFFLLLMIWVGISRIYVGVHYPLDIIGGIFVGIISLILAKQIVSQIKLRFFH